MFERMYLAKLPCSEKERKIRAALCDPNNFSIKSGKSSKSCLVQLPKGSAFKTLEAGQK